MRRRRLCRKHYARLTLKIRIVCDIEKFNNNNNGREEEKAQYFLSGLLKLILCRSCYYIM